ncbi:zinc-dependent alcohol dehydrogenase family protein [Solimonas variicoloris]|uniref:zinc-dependent alcohol dehydrogenase family protein n=1 Tax=Solimonas variicoloris TaxID=254408 RepID=UPI0003617FAD|nr:zinc-dependent alcohol dehydrogenase family protein [Solimonas variicoloris]
MKVRAAVLREMGRAAPYADSRPLAIETVELDPPGPGELLVKIRAAGLCHSDLSVIDGSRPRVLPMVLGHEAAGEVLAIGADVRDFAPGDAVVFSFVPVCGHCAYCAEGRAALCEPGARANTAGTLLSGAQRWHADGAPLHHHLGVSAFAEATVVSARSAVKIGTPGEPRPDWAIAALFGCAVMTGVGAVVNTARVAPGDSVAIFGLGGVGLAALLGAVAAGAEPLIAVDVLPAKLELARSLGATHTILATEPDAMARLRELTRGGVRYAIETAGSEVALAAAYAATRRGGTTITAGLPDPSREFRVPAVSLVAEERTVKGSYMGSAVPARDLPRYLALHRAGRLPVERLLTHRLALDDINAAFDRLARGAAVRQVIEFP